MLYCRDTARLRHYSLSLSLLSFPLFFISLPLFSPLLYVAPRCAKGRPALVVIWLHCYPLCREFGVHSYPLPLLLPRFSAARHAHVNVHTHNSRIFAPMPCTYSPLVLRAACFSHSSFISLSLFPSFLFLSALLSLSLSGVLALVVPLCRYKPYVTYITPRPRASCSPPWPGPAIQIGEVPAPLHEITSLLLDFTFAENMPV